MSRKRASIYSRCHPHHRQLVASLGPARCRIGRGSPSFHTPKLPSSARVAILPTPSFATTTTTTSHTNCGRKFIGHLSHVPCKSVDDNRQRGGRYWTRGGALRNVPVGGGCRRNKRSKGRGGSKSQATATSTGSGALPTPQPPRASAELPFLPPLQTLGHYGDSELQVGTDNDGCGGHVMVPNGLLLGEQWRVHQFPFLASMGTAPSGGLFQFDHSDHDVTNSNPGLNLMPRNLLGLSESFNYQPSWNGSNSINAWTDVSGLASTSVTSHHQ